MTIRSGGGWPPYGGEPRDMIEIDQLISAYAHSLDANRFEDCASLFTDAGILEVVWQDADGNLRPMNGGKGCKLTGHAERIRFHRTVKGNPPPLPRKKNGEGHQLINRLINVTGDTGLARVYRVGGAMQYECEVTRMREGWRFSRVLIIYDKEQQLP